MASHIMPAIARQLKRSISGTYADTNRFLSWIFAIFEVWIFVVKLKILGKFVWALILLCTFSSPYRQDQFAVLYFIQIVFVLIQVYDNCEIRKHSTVCRCETDAI